MLAKDPVLLAFDTSTEQLAVGLATSSARLKCCAPGGAAASASLLPQLRALLVQAQLQWSDLQALAFGQGPGAFTGLRTSCAVAQGLGMGLGLPLLAIDSLLVVAQDAREQWLAGHPERAPLAFEVGVVMDARMDEVYACRYRWMAAGVDGAQSTVNGTWQVLGLPALYPLPVLLAAWQALPLQALAGSALAAFGSRLHLPQTLLRFGAEADRPEALLTLALQSFAQGQAVDAAQALPLYLRDKVAQTTEERATLAAAKQASTSP